MKIENATLDHIRDLRKAGLSDAEVLAAAVLEVADKLQGLEEALVDPDSAPGALDGIRLALLQIADSQT